MAPGYLDALCGCKNGISSYEIHRDLGVSQKTAWFMLHRIREAMQDKTANKLGGEVEIDETFIGAKARNMHKSKRAEKITGRGPEGKEIVFGMVERGGKVIVDHVETRKKKELQSLIRERVEAGAAIFSDELKSYDGLDADYKHQVINHAVECVNGNVHTEHDGKFLEPSEAWTARDLAHQRPNRSTCRATLMSKHFATTTARLRTLSGSQRLCLQELLDGA